MKKNINFKFAAGIFVFLLFFLGISRTASAGQLWDKYSLGAKSLAGDILGRISPNSGTYLKTTNFGIGSRIGNFIDSPFSSLRSGAGYISSGLNGRLSNLNTLIRSSGLWSTTSIRQSLPSLSAISGSLPSLSSISTRLSSALNKMGTNYSTNLKYAIMDRRGNFYELNSSSNQKSTSIFSHFTIKTGLQNPLLSGKIPTGRITNLNNIKVQ